MEIKLKKWNFTLNNAQLYGGRDEPIEFKDLVA